MRLSQNSETHKFTVVWTGINGLITIVVFFYTLNGCNLIFMHVDIDIVLHFCYFSFFFVCLRCSSFFCYFFFFFWYKSQRVCVWICLCLVHARTSHLYTFFVFMPFCNTQFSRLLIDFGRFFSSYVHVNCCCYFATFFVFVSFCFNLVIQYALFAVFYLFRYVLTF